MAEIGGRKRIMMVAGEASGDLHGGNLAAALRGMRPDLEIMGMGGAAMRRAGVDTLADISSVAVVGFWEVLAHLPAIKKAYDKLARAITVDKPSLVILIDYPDFNLRLARVARSAGVPVVYYIAPQVWAWRRGRLKVMAGLIRKVLVIYPFEEEFYRRAGIDCLYVGNPLLDDPGENAAREELAGRFGLDFSRPVLGLLPGSRRQELSRHLPIMLKTWKLIRREVPGVQGIIPVADSLTLQDFAPYLKGGEGIKLVERDTPAALEAMDAAAVVSGTATLQTALHGKPMVIIYRLSPFTYMLGKLLVRVKRIGLVNIVAGEEVAPELIQGRATPENIARLLVPLLTDRRLYERTAMAMNAVRAKLGSPGASKRAAAEILALLDSTPGGAGT